MHNTSFGSIYTMQSNPYDSRGYATIELGKSKYKFQSKEQRDSRSSSNSTFFNRRPHTQLFGPEKSMNKQIKQLEVVTQEEDT